MRRRVKILNILYLCYKRFPAVPFHSHGKVEPCPGVVVVLQTGQNQVQVLPVHTALFSLKKEDFMVKLHCSSMKEEKNLTASEIFNSNKEKVIIQNV